MMSDWLTHSTQWWANATATDAPLLPTLAAQQVWMHGAWAVVLVWAVVALLRRVGLRPAVTWSAAGLVAAWTCMPGAYAPGYWLGLAFQAPSLVSVTLCATALLQTADGHATQRGGRSRQQVGWVLWAGIASGWLLLLDTFALLPGVQLYAWGFSAMAPAVLFAAVGLPWVLKGARSGEWILSMAMACVFMVLHLPSGNVWDAVLDPWLWAALHVWAWRLRFTRAPVFPRGRDRQAWPS